MMILVVQFGNSNKVLTLTSYSSGCNEFYHNSLVQLYVDWEKEM